MILKSALTLLVATPLVLGFFDDDQAAKSETFKVDPVHSSVVFRVNHMNISHFYGRFNEIGGTLAFNDASPEKGAIEIELKTESIDTNSKQRDNHLKSPDFFNAKQYPAVTFKSTSIKKKSDKMLAVKGDLTMHGVTKSIDVDIERVGTIDDPRGGRKTGIAATFTIKRSDYGMEYGLPNLGDEITIMLGIEGGAK